MTKEYIKISLNELRELLRSDIMLSYNEKNSEDFKSYDRMDDQEKDDIDSKTESHVKYYLRCEEEIDD